MRLKYIVYCLIFLIIPAGSIQSHAEVDWGIYKTLNIEAPPIDLAVSLNGKWIFVLSNQGDLFIFSSVGITTGSPSVYLAIGGLYRR